jgi:hypothetical protein
MTLSITTQVASSGERSEEDESQMATSFAKTLRLFAEKQQLVESSPQSVAPKPVVEKKKLPRIVGSPLPAGSLAVVKKETAKRLDLVLPAQSEPIKIKLPKQPGTGLVSRAWAWLQKNHAFSATKQLRVSETVSLGEKRFVAVVHIEGQKFLVGGGSSGVSLLAQLDAGPNAEDARQPIAYAGGSSK